MELSLTDAGGCTTAMIPSVLITSGFTSADDGSIVGQSSANYSYNHSSASQDFFVHDFNKIGISSGLTPYLGIGVNNVFIKLATYIIATALLPKMKTSNVYCISRIQLVRKFYTLP